MIIAFYKAQYGNWLDRLISWTTWGPYSHCELIFEDGMHFSSSPRDKGCRFKMIPRSEHWDYFGVTATKSQEAGIRYWCETQIARPYDWAGAIFRLSPDGYSWYCSAICMAALRNQGLFPSMYASDHVTPNQLAGWFKTLPVYYQQGV